MSKASDNEALARDVQTWLRSRGHDVGLDGWAGKGTRAALRRAVSELGIPVDSPGRWPAPATNALKEFYGDPGTGQTTMELPWPMRLAWDLDSTVSRVTCHRLVKDSLRLILEELLSDVYNGDLMALREDRMDHYGGIFNKRRKRGGTTWSVHAFGAAIDLDTTRNGLSTAWPEKATMPLAVIELFERHGWTSLARVIGRDAMHFQATTWP